MAAPRLAAEKLLRRLVQPIRRLAAGIHVPGAKTAEARPPAVAPPVASGDGQEDKDSFQVTIDELCRTEVGRFQTQLQIISLVEFREAVGEKWWRIRAKVLMIAEGVIQSHLGPDNVFARHGEDAFILIFRALPPEMASERALAVAQDLGIRLMGADHFVGLDRPLALAVAVRLEDVLTDEGRLDPAAIGRAVAVERIEAVATAHGLDDGARAELRRHLLPSAGIPEAEWGVRRHLLPTPPEGGGEEEVAQGAKPDPGWRAMAPPPKDRGVPQWHKVERPAEAAPVPVGPPPVPAGAALSVLWRPTWGADNEAISASLARIRRVDAPDASPLEGGKAYPGADAGSAATLDRAVAAAAARALLQPQAATRRFDLILPLHWLAMASARRMEVLAALAAISAGRQTGRLVIELFGVPASVGRQDLTDTVRAARTVCREVGVRLGFEAALIPAAARAGATLVGIDLEGPDWAGRDGAAGFAEELVRVQAEAERYRLSPCLWGARRRSAVVAAVAAGFRYVNGPAMMRDADEPAKVMVVPKARLIAPAPARPSAPSPS